MPVWTQVETPDAAAPYWRDAADGQRRHVHELVVGAPSAEQDAVQREHARAIATIASAAMRAWRAGDGSEARRLACGASRLSEEIVGFWPASLNRRNAMTGLSRATRSGSEEDGAESELRNRDTADRRCRRAIGGKR